MPSLFSFYSVPIIFFTMSASFTSSTSSSLEHSIYFFGFILFIVFGLESQILILIGRRAILIINVNCQSSLDMFGAPPEMPPQIVVVVVYYSSSVSSGVPPDMYSVFYPTWSKIGSLGVAYYVPFGATPTRQVPYI